MRTRLLVGAATGLGAAALAIVPAASASASTTFTANGVNIRACSNTGCTIRGEGYVGQSVTEHSLTYGQMINCGGGWETSAWYYITDNSTGVTGYASACYLS